MAGKTKQEQRRLSKLVARYKQKERWMRWLIAVLLVLILLLLLLLGYATNWTRGLKKEKSTAPTIGALDGVNSAAAGTQTPVAGTGSGTTTSGQSGQTSNGGGTTSSSSKESSNTSTTTNNTTTTPGSTQSSILRDFYNSIGVGDSIDSVKARAAGLGIAVDCQNTVVVVQDCTFTQDGQTVTTRNIAGTGLITGITTTL